MKTSSMPNKVVSQKYEKAFNGINKDDALPKITSDNTKNKDLLKTINERIYTFLDIDYRGGDEVSNGVQTSEIFERFFETQASSDLQITLFQKKLRMGIF